MAKVLVLYATDYGSTKKLAEAVAAGALSVAGTEATSKSVEEATAEELLAADAILYGTPVHMGSMDWRIKKHIDTVCSGLWVKDLLVGKVGGVFATGSGFGNGGGGVELTLLSLLNNLAELGMVLLPLPKNTPGYADAGLQWGPYARAHDTAMKPVGLQEAQLVAAHAHGANAARLADALAGKSIFS